MTTSDPTPQFEILGLMSGRPVEAAWTDEGLRADDSLLQAAFELTVDGHVFVSPLLGRSLRASLLEPFPALLTIMQCLERVTQLTVSLPVDASWFRLPEAARVSEPEGGPAEAVERAPQTEEFVPVARHGRAAPG